MNDKEHIPVLASEVIGFLALKKGMVAVDATLGLGGHAELIAAELGKKGMVYAFEQDESNLEKASQRLEKSGSRFQFFHSNFVHLRETLLGLGVNSVDAVLFDLGVSSRHLDDPERGFSFRWDGPLDMRMDRRRELTAAEVVNRFGEKKIADLIYQFGEERQSRRIAAAIVRERSLSPINGTLRLAEIVARVKRHDRRGIHPATQTFQALRIYVNDELEVLHSAIEQAFALLKPQGRLAVISFHSLEDRLVKNFFRAKAASCICGPEVMRCDCGKKIEGEILTKKPVIAGAEEIKVNPRSRSAKLRVLEKK